MNKKISLIQYWPTCCTLPVSKTLFLDNESSSLDPGIVVVAVVVVLLSLLHAFQLFVIVVTY